MAEERNELNIARKKRRRKIATQRFRKFICGLLVIAVVCFGVWFCIKEDVAGIIGDRIATAIVSTGSFPREIAGTTVKATFTAGDNLGVVTDGVCYLFSQDGKQLLSFQHSMKNPKTDSSERRFLIYDQGGNKLIVRSRDKILFENTFESTIVNAKLSEEGWLTVVTTASRYASQVHVWNSNYDREIFTWSSADEYVACASVDSASKTVAAAALTANTYGQIVTHIHFFTTEAAIELSSREFEDVSVLGLEYNNKGQVRLICDSISVLLDTAGNIIGSTEYSECPIAFIDYSGADYSVLIFDRYTEARATELLFLGESMTEKNRLSVKGKYICKSADENTVAIYCGGVANIFDYMGERIETKEDEKDALLIQLSEEKLFAITRTEIEEILK